MLENADPVGEHARQSQQTLAQKYGLIGNVRGSGLFVGAELVPEWSEKALAADIATIVINRIRGRGVLMGKLGIHQNATKIRPPMRFSKDNADLTLSAFDDAMACR